MRNDIAILTPTYNRGYILEKAYTSLINQTNKKFEWVIVDDGSTDDTELKISKFIKDKKIKIKYYKKENGGKHTALNYGIEKISSMYTIFLDSDDILTNDAVSTIYEYFNKYRENEKIGCISFLKLDPNNKKIGKEMKDQEVISNHIDYRYNNNLFGDMAEVFKTDILKKYPFPVFKNEKFLSEAIVWNKIAFEYDTVYVNKGIYIADYLSDGLSKNFFKLVSNNPIGALENSSMFMNKRFNLKIRVKNAILYNGYKLRAKKKYKNFKHKTNNKILTTIMYIPGFMFYLLILKKQSKTKK